MEREFVRWLTERARNFGGVPIGIGDDAAVLEAGPGGRYVVTTDMLMEGIDFIDIEANSARIGRKSLAVNLSDLAAMAARPVAAFVAIALPRRNGQKIGESIFEGIRQLADQYQMTIAGGDTNSWDGPLVICITAIGEVMPQGPLLRNGAVAGDEIVVTGKLGGSILRHHFDFEPRIREALWAHEHFSLHAGMDISDGLSLDLARMAEASGCGAVIHIDAIPIAPDAYQLAIKRPDALTPLEHALHDGEDFELLLAVSPLEAQRMLADQNRTIEMTRIGHFIADPGIWQKLPDGRRVPLTPRGFEHSLS